MSLARNSEKGNLRLNLFSKFNNPVFLDKNCVDSTAIQLTTIDWTKNTTRPNQKVIIKCQVFLDYSLEKMVSKVKGPTVGSQVCLVELVLGCEFITKRYGDDKLRPGPK